MADPKSTAILWPQIIPKEGTREVIVGNATYLLRNETMFTAVQHSQGEFSEFFRSLRDEGKIFGHRCPQCRHLIIPPFMRRCPPCNFVELQKEYVKDVGVMAATPVITAFAPTRFKDQVPFGTGRVFLEASDGALTSTAMLVRVRTTLGMIRPGIYHKGTPVKLIFRAHRKGAMDDVFAVPQSELTSAQLAKSPLIENEVEWDRAHEAPLAAPPPEGRAALKEAVGFFRTLAEMVSQSPRATADLANWRRSVRIDTPAGSFGIRINNGRLEVKEKSPAAPDLIIRALDLAALVGWSKATTVGGHEAPQSPPLTDLVVEGTLVLSKPEMETITRLDRVPRSLRRDSILK